MTLFELQETIVSHFRQSFSKKEIADIKGHKGQFQSAKDIGQVSVGKTAVLIAWRGLDNCQKAAGEIHADIDWVVYIVARDSGKKKRDEVAGVIVNQLLPEICGNSWGVAFEKPVRVSGRNVTSHEIDLLGLCVWVVTWQQRMPISKLDAPTLYDWLAMDIDTDLTPSNQDDSIHMKSHVDVTATP